MILIIGGYAQGKLEFARKTFGLTDDEIADGAICSAEEISDKRCVNNLHLYIKRGMAVDLNRPDGKIIISDEVGQGVVPVDQFERQWRENVGRTCCVLADAAGEVYRVYAGIGVRIK